jgi:hypothetical protein
MEAEAALRVAHAKHRLGEQQLGRREQRRLAHLAAELYVETRGERLATARERRDQPAALRDPRVHGRAGAPRDQRLERLAGGEALVGDHAEAGFGDEARQAAEIARGERLLVAADPVARERPHAGERLVRRPVHVDVDAKLHARAEQPAHLAHARLRGLVRDLQLDLAQAVQALLDRSEGELRSVVRGEHAAVAEAGRAAAQIPRERALAERPPEGVEQRQVDGAPGRALRERRLHPGGRRAPVATRQEVLDLRERLEREADETRQDRAGQAIQGARAGLARHVGAGQTLAEADGAGLRHALHEHAVRVRALGRRVGERLSQGQVDAEQLDRRNPLGAHVRTLEIQASSFCSSSGRALVKST